MSNRLEGMQDNIEKTDKTTKNYKTELINMQNSINNIQSLLNSKPITNIISNGSYLYKYNNKELYTMSDQTIEYNNFQENIVYENKDLLTSEEKNVQKEDNKTRVFEIEDKCKICGKVAHNKCSKCKSAFYCSKDCQTLDWKKHKKMCKKLEKENAEDVKEFFGK